MNKAKLYIKDYIELTKVQCKFYKKHWLGTIIVEGTLIAAPYVIANRKTIINKVKHFKIKKKHHHSKREA